MGLFDFLKKSGKKLKTEEAQEAKAPQAPPATADPKQIQELHDRRKAAALVKVIEGMGFKVSELGVRVDDDVVTLTGEAANQGDREKVVLLVGNHEGIAKVDDRMTVAKEEAQATFYTVVSGDTLSKIAKQHYGDANKYPKIFEANKPMLKDPDEIYPGQVLRIPPLS